MIRSLLFLLFFPFAAFAGFSGNCYCEFPDFVRIPVGPRLDWGRVKYETCIEEQGRICEKVWSGNISYCATLYKRMITSDTLPRSLADFTETYVILPLCKPSIEPKSPPFEFLREEVKKHSPNRNDLSHIRLEICPTNLPSYQGTRPIPWEALGLAGIAAGSLVIFACQPELLAVSVVGGLLILGPVSEGGENEVSSPMEPISCH